MQEDWAGRYGPRPLPRARNRDGLQHGLYSHAAAGRQDHFGIFNRPH